MAVVTKVGDGSNTMFWKDQWLNGKRIKDIAHVVYSLVLKRIRNMRKVKEAMPTFWSIVDFQGALTVPVLLEYFELYQELEQVELQSDSLDGHIWQLSSTGQFSTKSSYVAMFQGAILFEPVERDWKTWAPRKCKIFIWLVKHNSCWTVNKLAKRGLDHPKQWPLCDQQPENLNHLLVSCVFVR
jgi:hypothetical protein